ncbi:MAG: PD-(D/E)XK nuclease family protein [Halanaerobiales bacterium]
MVKFVLGRAGSGKGNYIKKEILEYIKDSTEKNLILLVPEQYTLEAERDFLESTDLDGILSLEVLSFQRLLHKILSEVGGLHHRDINDLGKMMVFRHLFNEHSDEINIFKRVIRREGFLKDFNYLLTELKKNEIGPVDLDHYRKLLENPVLEAKMADIITIYKYYEQYLDERYEDQEDKFNLAINKIKDSRYIDDSIIWVEGFNGFTELEYHMIEQLIKKTERITFSLTIDGLNNHSKDRQLFEPVYHLYNKIKEIAHKNSRDIQKDILERGNTYADLDHLEKELYALPYSKYSNKVEHIDLYQASNPYLEIEYVARKIIELVRDRDYRWRDISVATGDINVYDLNIERVFTEYSIPYFFDEKRSIINNPIVKCILSSLKIIAGNYRYEDIFNYLKTGFSPLDRAAVEILENFVFEHGIKGKTWFNDFKQECRNYELDKINEYRKTMIEPFFFLSKGINESETVLEYTSSLFKFLKNIELKEKINRWINTLQDADELEYVSENSQIWSIVIEVFEQLIDIMGDENVELSDYISILETGFAEYELGIIPPTLDQVMIGSPDRTRSHDIKAHFLIGVNDGLLPSITENDGILMDDEKILLKNLGLQLSSDSRSRGQEEQLNIYSTITRPSEYLWMSFSQSDMEGKTLRPSLLIKKVEKIFTDLDICSDLQEDIFENDPSLSKYSFSQTGLQCNYDALLSDITIPEASLKYLLSSLRRFVETGKLSEKWQQVFVWYYNDKKWNQQLNKIIEGFFHSNQQVYLYENQSEITSGNSITQKAESLLYEDSTSNKDSKLRKLYNLPLQTSISRLQQYYRCPFAHYVNYALRPVERKEYRLEAVDFGNLYHQIIEEFGNYLLNNNLNWSRVDIEEIEPFVDEIVDRIVSKFENSIFYSSKRYSYLINKVKRVAKRIIKVIGHQLKNGEFQPAFYELSFSAKGDIPSLSIETAEDYKIEIKGRIDRVDIMVDDKDLYLKVIDYKTGTKKFSLSEVYYGLELQLVIYMTALLKNQKELLELLFSSTIEEVAAATAEKFSLDVSNKNIEISPAGFFYFHIDDPLVNQNDVQDGQIEDEIIKELKLDGIVLDKKEVIESLDRNLEPGDYSSIIPVKLNKDGSPGKNSSVLSNIELELLINHVLKRIGQAGSEIIEGRIKVEPVKVSNKYTACDYCPYDAICQFDCNFIDNEYREISNLKDYEVLELIEENRNDPEEKNGNDNRNLDYDNNFSKDNYSINEGKRKTDGDIDAVDY